MLEVKYAFSFFLQKTKPFRKFQRLFPTPLTHTVEVVMCLHVFPIRLQTLLRCLILQGRAGYYGESAVHTSSFGFGGIAAVSLLDMWRAPAWSFVHVSLKLCVTVETHRCYIAGKTVPDSFLFDDFLLPAPGVTVHCLQVP